MTQSGTAQSARLLAGMSAFAKRDMRDGYFMAIGAFVTPGEQAKHENIAIQSTWARRDLLDPIPDRVQRQLLGILCEAVNSDATKPTLENVSAILARLCRPETKDALRQLLASPFALGLDRS